jgi:hypothetical protein
MDFETRDFGERDENGQRRQQQQSSPVDVALGIREELAEFQRNGGREALLARLRASREKDLRITMQGPDPFGLDFVVEYLRDRGLIRIERPRKRRRRDAENR